MKRLSFALAAILFASVFASCDKQEPQKEVVKYDFDAEEVIVNKPSTAAEGYEVPITASDNVSWTAQVSTSSVDWLELGTAQGQGNGTLTFSLDANIGTEARNATITVNATGGEGEFTAEKTIKVIQLGSEPLILLSPNTTQNCPSGAVEALEFEVTANVAWTASVEIVSGEGDWVSVASQSVETGKVTLSLTANDTPYVRDAKLVVSENGGDLKVEVAIQQAGSRVRLSILGMTGYLPQGPATMSITGVGTIELEVSEDETGTILYFDNTLAPGQYVIENIVSGETTYPMELSIEVVSVAEVNSLESWEPTMQIFGGDSPENPISVSSYEIFAKIMTNVNEGVSTYAGTYFLQTADIAIPADVQWAGIGVGTTETDLEGRPFSGNYDGGGFAVNGLKLEIGAMAQRALFNFVKGSADNYAQVKNVIVNGDGNAETYEIVAMGYVAAVVAWASDYSMITGCKNYADVKGAVNAAEGLNKTAGVVAEAKGAAVVIDGCENHGHIYAPGATGKAHGCGGVVAVADGPAYDDTKVVVKNCKNYGKCEFAGNSGGVVGQVTKNADIFRCANYAEMSNTSAGMRFGGVAGNVNGPSLISECFNLGSVIGVGGNQGGVVGVILETAHVENCYNKGTLTAPGNNKNNAGVVAHINTATGSVKNCYNAGVFVATDGKANGGAVAGSNAAANLAYISGCYYETGLGFTKGAGGGTDAAGVVEGLATDQIKTGSAFTGWDTSIWKFTAGEYPTLVNNPE